MYLLLFNMIVRDMGCLIVLLVFVVFCVIVLFFFEIEVKGKSVILIISLFNIGFKRKIWNINEK